VQHWCPEGYVTFPDIIAYVCKNSREWLHASSCPFDWWLDWETFSSEPLDRTSYEYGEAEFCQNVQNLLGTKLATKTLCAAAIHQKTGGLVWVPASTWRILEGVKDSNIGDVRNLRTNFEQAIMGKPIKIPRQGGTFDYYIPIISERALAEVFRVDPLPPPPPPIELVELDPPFTPPPASPSTPLAETINSDKSDQAALWMRGYAQGFVDASRKVVKREAAIKACTEAMPCSTRIAEAAYEALPHPALRNGPRTSKPTE